MAIDWGALNQTLAGELFTDDATRILYATDASAYRELPLAVVMPQNERDIQSLIKFCTANGLGLIPRAAGTSLAGQVVGEGVVVDVGRHMNRVLEVNAGEHWVRVQPGVVRDELNRYLKPYQLFFAPETSTANRAMIGGMVGNNSCGSNSIVYGATRDHLLEVKAFLSDGSAVEFKALSFDDFIDKCNQNSIEGNIYREVRGMLSDYTNQTTIREHFPKPSVVRRNTGYALDALLDCDPFTAGGPQFNFCKLIAGSEGTLCFITEIKLNLMPLPKGESGVLCIQFNSVDEALRANLIALQYQPQVCELIDHYILECTRHNPEQAQNRFFVEGEPSAILAVEYLEENEDSLMRRVKAVQDAMQTAGLGYHFTLLRGNDQKRVWELRKAGLGLLSNLPSDEKAVSVIEDTAVAPEDLPAYIAEFNQLLARHELYAVHYAHVGAGELHLRPILNLKTAEGLSLFRTVATEVAALVKKYKGSLSGEHGDGRLRGEFIASMIGEHNYRLLQTIKQVFDPKALLNPGKITQTPPMDTHLRYPVNQPARNWQTVFRFLGQNILQHAEQCNGSGDCRKSHLAGGTMCPSYMATRNEADTTRARANMLREMLTRSGKENPFDHEEIKQVMDLCLSCKGCKAECPSSVDMAKLKAEFLHQYYQSNGVPLRTKLIAGLNSVNKLASRVPGLSNFMLNGGFAGKAIKKLVGFATERKLPELQSTTVRKWASARQGLSSGIKGEVYFFCDEFTNYYDVPIGQKAILLLEGLGYKVNLLRHQESGRAAISKGLLLRAREIAEANVSIFSGLVSADMVLVGVEPSAILTFRDEYPDLVNERLLPAARQLAGNALLVEEFLMREVAAGRINHSQFTTEQQNIKLHGHCQQKAWSALRATQAALSLPVNYKVETIPSGCCGMAGSFGYEKEHYQISMQIGELILFPAVRQSADDAIIAAPGTSCRHQIKDGTKRQALHPVEVLWDALLKP